MFTHIAGYKFIPLTNLAELQVFLHEKCVALKIKGTILLSQEGININLAGKTNNIQQFISQLKLGNHFSDMEFHVGESDFCPFKRLKVKIKHEIITMRISEIHPEIKRAPEITPQEFKQWLDEKRDITILDTRNDYEVQFGSFENHVNLKIKDFGEFQAASANLPKDKPIVMFCTGGIRCEKAALQMLQDGFQEVYQLQKGILNYFKEVGDAHFKGECFVFDERVAVDATLKATGTQQCKVCQMPVKNMESHFCN